MAIAENQITDRKPSGVGTTGWGNYEGREGRKGMRHGGTAAPMFVASLAGATVNARNDMGVWAVDNSGLLRLVFCEGQGIGTKSLLSFTVLSEVSGSPGEPSASHDAPSVAHDAPSATKYAPSVVDYAPSVPFFVPAEQFSEPAGTITEPSDAFSGPAAPLSAPQVR